MDKVDKRFLKAGIAAGAFLVVSTAHNILTGKKQSDTLDTIIAQQQVLGDTSGISMDSARALAAQILPIAYPTFMKNDSSYDLPQELSDYLKNTVKLEDPIFTVNVILDNNYQISEVTSVLWFKEDKYKVLQTPYILDILRDPVKGLIGATIDMSNRKFPKLEPGQKYQLYITNPNYEKSKK